MLNLCIHAKTCLKKLSLVGPSHLLEDALAQSISSGWVCLIIEELTNHNADVGGRDQNMGLPASMKALQADLLYKVFFFLNNLKNCIQLQPVNVKIHNETVVIKL